MGKWDRIARWQDAYVRGSIREGLSTQAAGRPETTVESPPSPMRGVSLGDAARPFLTAYRTVDLQAAGRSRRRQRRTTGGRLYSRWRKGGVFCDGISLHSWPLLRLCCVTNTCADRWTNSSTM